MQPSTETIGSLVLDRSYDDYGRKSGLSVTMGGSVLNVDYEYDSATGRLSSAKIDDTHAFHYSYLWGFDLSGSLEGAGGEGGLTAARKKNGTPIDVAFLYDGNGNVTQLVDLADESREAHYEYDPLGKEIVASGDSAEWNKFRFITKYLEDAAVDASAEGELGLYYYGYRYYSPRLGRWITRDPAGEAGGVNLYLLNFNSTPNIIDILGLSPRDVEKRNCQWVLFLGHIGPDLEEELGKYLPFDQVPCGDRIIGKFCGHNIVNSLIPESCRIPGTGLDENCPDCETVFSSDHLASFTDWINRNKLNWEMKAMPKYCTLDYSSDLQTIENIKGQIDQYIKDDSAGCCKSISLKVNCLPGSEMAYIQGFVFNVLSRDTPNFMYYYPPPKNGLSEEAYRRAIREWLEIMLPQLKSKGYKSPCEKTYKIEIEK
jgi:RHS repeat-associated protein